MGIDVYARWNGMTDAEEKAQYTGFSITSGHLGYLREAYHGGPYATEVLIPEGWEEDEPAIPAAILEERLPATLDAIKERAKNLYDNDPDYIAHMTKSVRDFVSLCKEKETETGQPVKILVSY